MCFTRRANKKVLKLTKIKSNKIHPEPATTDTQISNKFDALLEKSQNRKTKTI